MLLHLLMLNCLLLMLLRIEILFPWHCWTFIHSTVLYHVSQESAGSLTLMATGSQGPSQFKGVTNKTSTTSLPSFNNNSRPQSWKYAGLQNTCTASSCCACFLLFFSFFILLFLLFFFHYYFSCFFFFFYYYFSCFFFCCNLHFYIFHIAVNDFVLLPPHNFPLHSYLCCFVHHTG